MTSISAFEVMTLAQGTLAIINGLRENEDATSVAFFDKNRNGKLDEGDQKILVVTDKYECPKGGKKIKNDGGRPFCVMPVKKDDVDYYGQAVSDIFKKAMDERSALPQVVKSQSEGFCTVDAEKVEEPLYSTSLKVRFEPAFSLKTQTKSNRYTVAELKKIFQNAEGTPALDPARCYETETYFNTQLSGQEVGMRLYISGRPYSFAPFYAGILEAVGLKDIPSLAHIFYEVGTAKINHLNIQ